MSPAALIDQVRTELFAQLHGGTGMIEKSKALEIIEEKTRTNKESTENDDLTLILKSLENDVKECYTFRELMEIINGVESDDGDQ